MSSGLLYLAIVGVWALVLVPMWLRGNETGERSRARLLSRRPGPTTGPAYGPRPPDGGTPGQAPGHPPERAYATGTAPGPDVAAEPGPERGRHRGDTDPARVPPPTTRPAAAPAAVGAPTAGGRLPGGRSRARVIARRRRRLFGISLLFVTAVILAMSRLAPSWVIGPPAVLFVAYLAVLRAAGQIDVERRQFLAARASSAASRRTDTRADASVASAETDAEVIALTPGSRGANEPYDQYTDAGLRAVGD